MLFFASNADQRIPDSSKALCNLRRSFSHRKSTTMAPSATVASNQGDQMSFRKSRPKCSPTTFCQKCYILGTVKTNSPKFCTTSVIFKLLPKVNTHPIGGYSPNLVTLLRTLEKSIIGGKNSSRNCLTFGKMFSTHVNGPNRVGCYDHNFPRFLTIFGEKIGVFLKNQCYDQIFA
jgi:hypothetical protein